MYLNFTVIGRVTNDTKYSRTKKFKAKWSVQLYHFNFTEGYLPQILLNPFLSTLLPNIEIMSDEHFHDSKKN